MHDDAQSPHALRGSSHSDTPHLLENLRLARGIPTIELQAELIGVDRTTLQRLENGSSPSAAVMASICQTFDLGLGEAFEIAARQRVGMTPDLHRNCPELVCRYDEF